MRETARAQTSSCRGAGDPPPPSRPAPPARMKTEPRVACGLDKENKRQPEQFLSLAQGGFACIQVRGSVGPDRYDKAAFL